MNIAKYLLLFIVLTISNQLFAQHTDCTIVGRIIDKQSSPIPFATIAVQGTTIATSTNENGEFTLKNLPQGNHIITITGVGVESKQLPVTTDKKVINLKDITVENSVELDEAIGVGKSEARKQQEIAYPIAVLDMKKIHSNTSSLNKILNNASGVRIREEGGMGSGYSFNLNGFSGNQVKFFLDGIPMDNFGSSFSLSNISTNMAERIDVYKGVLPVSLGADALGGAVNIISRKDANYIDASYSIGSFNTHKLSLNGAYTNLKSGFTLRVNSFYNYSDNDYKVHVPIEDLSSNKIVETAWVKRFHDQYKSAGVKLETGIVNKPYADYLLAGVIVSGNDKDIQTGATMDAVYGMATSRSNSVIPSIRYKKDDLLIDGLSVSLHGAYSFVNDYYVDTAARKYSWLGEYISTSSKGENFHTDSKFKNKQLLTNANISYVISSWQSITLNHVLSSTNRKIHDKVDPDNESNKIPQKLTKNISGLGWLLTFDKWNANIFAKLYSNQSSTYKWFDRFTDKERMEKISLHKTYFGYGAATTYHILPFLQAKVSYEQAYRLPESTEMFGDGMIQKHNPDLKAENSSNFNLSVTFDKRILKHSILLDVGYIHRNTKDFILKEVSLTSDPTTAYQNIGKVLTNGFEGGLKYSWNNIISVGANLTYQNIIDNQQFESNTGSYVGSGIIEHISYKERLPNIPYLFGHADLGFRFQNIGFKNTVLTLDYALNYVKDYYLSFPGLGAKASKKVIPEQISHDLALGYAIANGTYSITLECNNITNERLYDNYRLQKPGRSYSLKLRWFIKK